MPRSISLVLPLFNEIDYIKITVPKAISVLDSIGIDYEVIIVDDASFDGSEKIAEDFAKANSKIKVIRHEVNERLGTVLRSGFAHATKDIIIYTDMDMPFDLDILKNIIFLAGQTDILHGLRVGSERSIRRIIYSKLYNLLIRLLFRVNIGDINFALKIFGREILSNLALKSKSSFLNAEFLIKAKYAGYKIRQIPVKYLPRKYGRSRLSSLDNIIQIVLEMIKFYPEIISYNKKFRVKRASI